MGHWGLCLLTVVLILLMGYILGLSYVWLVSVLYQNLVGQVVASVQVGGVDGLVILV